MESMQHDNGDKPLELNGLGRHPSSSNGQMAEPVLSKAQAARLLLKTDLVVMPLAILSMTLAFLDKVGSNNPCRLRRIFSC